MKDKKPQTKRDENTKWNADEKKIVSSKMFSTK